MNAFEPAPFYIVAKGFVGYAMGGEPVGIDEIPSGHRVENFLQILRSSSVHDALNRIISKKRQEDLFEKYIFKASIALKIAYY